MSPKASKTKLSEVQKLRYVTIWLIIISVLVILVITLETYSPMKLADNQATLDAFTKEANLTSTFIAGSSYTPTILLTDSLSETPEPSATVLPASDTPVPTTIDLPFIAVVRQTSECYNGPDEKYFKAPNIPSDTHVDVLGKDNSDGTWMLVDSVSIDTCWIKSANLYFEFNLDALESISVAITRKNSVCRTGPTTQYREQTFIPKDWKIVVIGKSDERGDWLLVTPHDSTIPCWIAGDLLTVKNPPPIPLADTPDPPTITPIVIRPTSGSGRPQTPGSGGYTPNPPTPTLVPPPTPCLNPQGHEIPCH